jgi:pseudaminic acid biosynthesis-associated methylase
MQAVEINPEAARQLGELIGPANVHAGSLFDFRPVHAFDLVLVKGVLIHLHPERLADAYASIYSAARRLILVAEYYNPTPVSVPYRGHADRLFKRDFAGELLERHPDLVLRDYGFAYRRDPAFPQDDITWFLLEKQVARTSEDVPLRKG